MKKTIVVMTKSSKYRNLCVAGIDCETGDWIRLVSTDDNTHGAITFDDIQFENGQYANLLDVINVEVTGKENNMLQPENYIINRDYYIEYVNTITIEDAVNLFREHQERFIFGNTAYYVDEAIVPTLGKSLFLVAADNLYFEQQVNDSGQPKTKLSFEYNGYYYTDMSVTDSRFYNIQHGQRYEHAFLAVSIGTPFRGKCYKFVAAIYIL